LISPLALPDALPISPRIIPTNGRGQGPPRGPTGLPVAVPRAQTGDEPPDGPADHHEAPDRAGVRIVRSAPCEQPRAAREGEAERDRKSTRLNSSHVK